MYKQCAAKMLMKSTPGVWVMESIDSARHFTLKNNNCLKLSTEVFKVKLLNVITVNVNVIIFQELQRRLDQTLGKPGSYHHGIDREGHIKPMTFGARLYRLENQVCQIFFILLSLSRIVGFIVKNIKP